MSRRIAGLTTAYQRISDGSMRKMLTPVGGIMRIADSDVGAGTAYAKRADGKDVYTPLGHASWIRADSGTIDVEIIE